MGKDRVVVDGISLTREQVDLAVKRLETIEPGDIFATDPSVYGRKYVWVVDRVGRWVVAKTGTVVEAPELRNLDDDVRYLGNIDDIVSGLLAAQR